MRKVLMSTVASLSLGNTEATKQKVSNVKLTDLILLSDQLTTVYYILIFLILLIPIIAISRVSTETMCSKETFFSYR